MNRNLEHEGARSRRDVLEPLFRHKKRALAFLAAVTLAALGILAFTPSEYTSTAKLIVRRSRENVFLNPMTGVGDARSVQKTWTSEVKSELEILGNQELILSTIQQLGADRFLFTPEPKTSGKLGLIRRAFNPIRLTVRRLARSVEHWGAKDEEGANRQDINKALEIVGKKLAISGPEDSDIIVVSYTAHNPEFAREVVNHLIDAYLSKRIEILQVPGTQQFFSQQSDVMLAALNTTENAIMNLKGEAGISTLEDNRRTLQQTIEAVRTRKLDTESALAASAARIDSLRYRLQHPESAVSLRAVPVPIGDTPANTTTAVLLARMDSSTSPASRSGPAGSDLGDVVLPQADVNHVMLNPEEYKLLFAALHDEESSQSALEAEQGKIEQQLHDLQEEMNRITRLEVPLSSLERERSQLEEKYRKFSDNLELSRINQELERKRISNVSVVQHATLPRKPDSSGKLMKLLAAMFLGLCGATGLAYAGEALDPTMRSARDITARLGLDTLAELPRLQRKEMQLSRTAPAPADTGHSWPVWPWPHHSHEASDGLQDLYVKLLALRPTDSRGPFMVGLTSTIHGEGVSTITALLCQSFAYDGRFADILLLDAHPGPHAGMRSEMGHAPFAYRSVADASGPSDQEAPGSERLLMEGIVQARELDYDIVVVDMPPMAQGSHPLRVAAAVDCVALVVDAGRVPWREVQRSVDLLGHTHARLCGIVLNRKHEVIPKWIDRKL